jgi:signal transduction histidine kinase
MQDSVAHTGPFRGLSVKLIATIVVVILAVEVAVYIPSVANFRASWLNDRLRVAIVAANVLDTVPDIMAVPRTLTDQILTSAGADALVYRREGQSELIELAEAPTPRVAVTADMRADDPLTQIMGALDTMMFGGPRTLRIVGNGDQPGVEIELLMSERPLRQAMFFYSRNIAILSLIIAAITAIVLYVFVSVLFIAPIRRLSDNMLAWRKSPENATLILRPSLRRDEIGIVERELAAMETEIYTLLRQRRHLADLGLAVAKINHDLRNTLTAAQLLSDQVATLDDPKVQRLAPRLVTTLDRAIGFAQSVIDYGRQSAAAPHPERVDLRELVSEAASDAGMTGHPDIALIVTVPAGLTASLDRAQITRVFANLIKNAREALEASAGRTPDPAITVGAALEGEEGLLMFVSDNGPGLPPRARENLFVAFEGSARAGGTGLGLAIARELIEGHGGQIRLADTEAGTRFEIVLPQASPAEAG